MVRVFGGKNSRASQRALRWMEERGVSYRFFDLDAARIDARLLNAWFNTFGWQMLIDKRTAGWRNQSSDLKNTLGAAEALALLCHRPNMLKTPIIGVADIWLLGWNAPNKVRLLGQIPPQSRNARTSWPDYPQAGANYCSSWLK